MAFPKPTMLESLRREAVGLALWDPFVSLLLLVRCQHWTWKCSEVLLPRSSEGLSICWLLVVLLLGRLLLFFLFVHAVLWSSEGWLRSVGSRREVDLNDLDSSSDWLEIWHRC